MVGNGRAHQLQVVDGAALCAVACGRFDEISTRRFRKFAAALLLRVRQVARFQNHLDNRVPAVRKVANLLDFTLHIRFIAANHFADVDDHVQLFAALIQRQTRFVHLNLRGVCAVREADDGAHLDVAAAQHFRQNRHVAGTRADGRSVVLERKLAAAADIILRQERLERAVVEHTGNIMGGQRHKLCLLCDLSHHRKGA